MGAGEPAGAAVVVKAGNAGDQDQRKVEAEMKGRGQMLSLLGEMALMALADGFDEGTTEVQEAKISQGSGPCQQVCL